MTMKNIGHILIIHFILLFSRTNGQEMPKHSVLNYQKSSLSDNINGRLKSANFVIEPALEEENNLAENIPRSERKLPHNKKLNKKESLIFEDEDYDEFVKDTIYKTVSRELIVRLEEKYDYYDCKNYLDSVHDSANLFFKYDESLVNIGAGTEADREEKRSRFSSTFHRRYRYFGETCNFYNEQEFWREMFLISLNDTMEIGGVTLQRPKHELMFAWNNIWIKYARMGVCNQRLLLECTKNKKTDTLGMCDCRKTGVGLSTLFDFENLPPEINDNGVFITQHFFDSTYIEHGQDYRIWGAYNVTLQCVLTASLADDDVHTINPCDFTLPMIGLCTAKCVENATCTSVGEDEKAEIKEYVKSSSANDSHRIREQRVLDGFHNKCVCQDHTICVRQFSDKQNRGATLPISCVLTLFAFIFIWITKVFCNITAF